MSSFSVTSYFIPYMDLYSFAYHIQLQLLLNAHTPQEHCKERTTPILIVCTVTKILPK